MVNFRAFIENSKIYMDTYKYSRTMKNPRIRSDTIRSMIQLNAYAHAIEMLNRTNMDLSLLVRKATGQLY